MLQTKIYIYSLTLTGLFSCSQGISAMIETQKIKEIKDHGLRIEKNTKTQSEPDFLISDSIKVYQLPINGNIKNLLLLDEKTIATLENDSTVINIFNIRKGCLLSSIQTGKININVIIKARKNIIISGDGEGNIKIWDLTKKQGNNHIGLIKTENGPIRHLIRITNNVFCFYTDNGIFQSVNWENINKPLFLDMFDIGTNPFAIFEGLEPIGEGKSAFWDSKGTIIIFDKDLHMNSFTTLKEPNGLSVVTKLHGEKLIMGFYSGSIKLFNIDFNTDEKLSVSCYSYMPKEMYSFENTIGERVTHFLELPNNDSIVCSTPKKIDFLNPKTLQWTHKIDFSQFKTDIIKEIRFLFHVPPNKIVAITNSGLIITIDSTITKSKDMTYFFKNLGAIIQQINNPEKNKKKKRFKDLHLFCYD